MHQFTTIAGIGRYLESQRERGISVGFVPTMGALHEGHLNLVERSKRENDLTVCSIFVNPIQFNNSEDLAKYPRTISSDLKLLDDIRCDAVFMPGTEEMYPREETVRLDLDFGMLDKVMEGKFRPGHFSGVAIVVRKLFDIVQPDRAYFGKKDFQQLAVIRFMVNKLRLPVEIIPCETVRDPDGLAMSSRNARLSPSARKIAPKIHEALIMVKNNAGRQPVELLKKLAIKKISENPEMRVEYFEIGDKESLMPIETWEQKEHAVAFVAVFLGDVRLIDNIELFL